MKNKGWIIFFIVVLFANLIAVYLGNEILRYVTKPLLMPLLVIYFVSAVKFFSSSLKKWITLALVFSWLGDVLLIFDEAGEIFFIAGLVAFLWAHIWYIFFFQAITKNENIGSKTLLVLPGLFLLGILIDVLDPSSLGVLKWPVEIYGVILMTMLTGALHMGYIKKKWFGLLIISGALLFVISDSMLALNKFYKPFEYAGVLIMLTYGIAQLLITIGAVRYITSTSKQ